MRVRRLATTLLFLLGGAASASAQSVTLRFHDGHVDLRAQNAPIRTVLTEWARLGGTHIVNLERVAGPPVTLELTDTPERQALDILLRNVTGYIVGARAAATPADKSAFDRILLVATSGPGVPRPPAARPLAPEPPVQVEPDPDDDPASDVPPEDEFRSDADRRRVPVPRLPSERSGDPDSAQGEPAAPADPDAPQPSPVRKNPFGVQSGSSTPGVIFPVPRKNDDQDERTIQPDQEP